MAYTEHDFQCAIVGTYYGSTHLLWSCTFAIHYGDDNDPAQVAYTSSLAWVATFADHQAANVNYVEMTARRLTDDVTYTQPIGSDATDAGTLYNPSNVALVYTHTTVEAGVKGRNFLPYVLDNPVDAHDPSIWGSSTHSTYDDLFDDFRAALYGADPSLVFCVNSRKFSALYAVTTSTLNNVPGQMGKRRYG